MADQGIKFQFWKCPAKNLKDFQAPLIPWQKRYGNTVWLVAVAYGEAKIQAPATAERIEIVRGPRELKSECSELERKIATATEQMAGDSGYLNQLKKYRLVLTDKRTFAEARDGMSSHGHIFGLKGWTPQRQIDEVKAIAGELPVAITIADPDLGEQPPTLIENPRWVQSILDIVKLYATPGYEEWDPSASVYFAFVVFFSMIVGDAGYGLFLLLLILGTAFASDGQ